MGGVSVRETTDRDLPYGDKHLARILQETFLLLNWFSN